VGGSRGAMMVNKYVFDMIESMAKNHPEVLFVTATGKDYFAEYSEKYRAAGLDSLPNVRVSEYIYDMPVQMAAADVVIARAGAMTLSELALMKKACVLIPSPNVSEDHQYKNAKALQDANAAILVRETELKEGSLQKAVCELLASHTRRTEQEANIASFAKEDACLRIWQDIVRMTAK
jgi:UDP-N-acetylglucosamine--N-acetylmuramyl-(pentapeptide) pyrophosphoryl-undecaprenol N-acetylglucosamine transferase